MRQLRRCLVYSAYLLVLWGMNHFVVSHTLTSYSKFFFLLHDDHQVGIQLDEPSGSNDGSVKGSRKFECPDKYGAFARGANIAVGDFPERDLFGSDDEGEEGCEKDCGHDHSKKEEDDDQDEF